MINNLELIKSLLTFDSADDFYHLQIIKRKKEHPELGSNSYIVKTYYIRSLDYLDRKFGEIVVLCDYHNARACINLNRRSFEKCSLQTLRKLTDQILNKDFASGRKAYESVCGSYSNEPVKKWIVDIDTKDKSFVQVVCNDIKNCEPDRRTDKVIVWLETKNGWHLITTPFRLDEFKSIHPGLDIHKDNPTILYIP